MDLWIAIRNFILTALSIFAFYKTIYQYIGFFVKAKKFDPAPQTRKYGIVIAARNEELVIGNLVNSLYEQTYPRDKFQVFVVADNCDKNDRTAEIARECGAIVYERCCPEKARKGWALEYLFENIEKDFGIQSYDGYLFFDADNVVSRDYLERMNEAFATGVDGVIGYRNSKNFEQNWISAHYSIHFMRSSYTLHRPRGRLNLCTHIAGTGYLLSSDMLKDGWHYYSLTEDTQATMDFAVQGKRIEYCEAAEFYDEQPYQIKVMLRQRLRWAKGRMACFFRYGAKLFYGLVRPFKVEKEQNKQPLKIFDYQKGVYKTLSFRKKITFLIDRVMEFCSYVVDLFAIPFRQKGVYKTLSFREKITFLIDCVMDFCSYVVDLFAIPFRYIAKNYTNYDMIFYLLPISFIRRMLWIASYIAGIFVLGDFLQDGVISEIGKLAGILFGTGYIGSIGNGLLIVIREWKHIHCPNKLKLAFYLVTWPLHDMIYPFICLASLFMHVTWKPIKHDVAKTLDDIHAN